jgi:molybdopterin-guanine dinucleotide biosynthesis protein A
MMPMFDVQGFILVGGASTRMGKDKAQLLFGNRTSVELIAAALQSAGRSVTTVGGQTQGVSTLPNIPDLRQDWGPLAGMEAAFRQAKSEYCLIVACDFPFVTPDLFAQLLESMGEDSDALVPLQSDGRPQPLCAVYRITSCLIAAENAILAGKHSPRDLLERVTTRYLPFTEFSHLESSEHFFFNVNTPESYQKAQQIFDQLKCQNGER